METATEQTSPDTGKCFEDDIAQQLGLNRDEMRNLRKKHLVEGVTWMRENKRTVITAEGVTIIKTALGVSVEHAPEKKAPGEELTVLRIPSRNTRILEAEKKDGRRVRVRVHNNVNFVPGMTIRARTDGPYEDVMTLEGRCPRFRGRW